MSSPIIETEETLIIETPERVPLAFSLASIGNRFIAAAVDHLIQFTSILVVVWAILALMGVSVFSGGDETASSLLADAPKWVVAILIVAVFLLFAGYFAVFEWWWDGQT
ncbi:MAG: RDD family protein, partial [Pyrinomonadaceae bacterium]|nr:RDD family protein [Pyrinomonadaceae bacterium]